MTTRSALISGAGIAGPVLAFWLTEAGWDVTVVERAERLRTSGYPIDIRGTAIEVVERMGLSTQIAAHRYQHVPLQVLTPGGRRLCRLDLGQLANDAEAGDVEITRGELTRILFDASADRAECLFGDSITALTDTGDGVDVTFSRHGHRRFDVVIGADGIHSKVRALAFGPDARYLHHLDAYVTIWDIDNEMFSPQRVTCTPTRAAR